MERIGLLRHSLPSRGEQAMVSIYNFNHLRRLVPRVLDEQWVRVDLRLRDRHQNPERRCDTLVEPGALRVLIVPDQILAPLALGCELEQPLIQYRRSESGLRHSGAERLVRLEYAGANLIQQPNRCGRLSKLVERLCLNQHDLGKPEMREVIAVELLDVGRVHRPLGDTDAGTFTGVRNVIDGWNENERITCTVIDGRPGLEVELPSLEEDLPPLVGRIECEVCLRNRGEAVPW